MGSLLERLEGMAAQSATLALNAAVEAARGATRQAPLAWWRAKSGRWPCRPTVRWARCAPWWPSRWR
ncbi:hypothetical protein LP420_37580 [Massilia sp. B-10]|nr:hypothetical protein LP420_37580 [Massilia sp. B-10]